MSINYSLLPSTYAKKLTALLKNEKPTISIITPYYNGGKYIEETYKSVINQTYPFFEWVIVNDGSPNEEDVKILMEIAKRDSRIKVFSKENSGPSQTRDYAVAKTSKDTKYILFLDADDMIERTFIECAYWALETNPTASWAYCNMINFGGAEFVWDRYFTLEEEKKNNILNIMSLVKKSDFLSVGGFEIKEKSVYEDWNLWLKLLAKGKFPIKINSNLFWYRKSLNSGEFSRAQQNHKNAMRYIEETVKTIKEDVKAIQFPVANRNWNTTADLVNSMTLPKYEKSKKINVLMVFPWMTVGGADKFNLDLITGIDKSKFTITIITTEPSRNEWEQQFLQHVDAIYNLPTFLDRKYWPSFIANVVGNRAIDIIFNSNSFAGYYLLPYIKSTFPNVKIIDYVHSEDLYSRNGGYVRDSSVLGDIIDKTLVCTKYLKGYMSKNYPALKNNMDTIYIGTDEKFFDPSIGQEDVRNQLNISSNKRVILFVGRLSIEKRPLLFIDIAKAAYDKNSDLEFVVVGDGPLLNECKLRVTALGISHIIHFVGFDNDVRKYYKISDLTVNCSIREGLALIAFESLSMGVPFVASDVGGQAELIDSEVGRIVPCLQKEEDKYNTVYSKKEIDNYTKAIFDVLKNQKKYAQNGRQRILEGFTTHHMVKNIEKEFKNIMKKKEVKASGLSELNNLALDMWTVFINMDYLRYRGSCLEYFNRAYGFTGGYNKSKSAMVNFFTKIHFLYEAIAIKNILLNFKYLIVNIYRKIVKLIKLPFSLRK